MSYIFMEPIEETIRSSIEELEKEAYKDRLNNVDFDLSNRLEISPIKLVKKGIKITFSRTITIEYSRHRPILTHKDEEQIK